MSIGVIADVITSDSLNSFNLPITVGELTFDHMCGMSL